MEVLPKAGIDALWALSFTCGRLSYRGNGSIIEWTCEEKYRHNE